MGSLGPLLTSEPFLINLSMDNGLLVFDEYIYLLGIKILLWDTFLCEYIAISEMSI